MLVLMVHLRAYYYQHALPYNKKKKQYMIDGWLRYQTIFLYLLLLLSPFLTAYLNNRKESSSQVRVCISTTAL